MIQDLIKLDAIILNSPPYSPDYNPIEETFTIIHNKLKFKLITNKRNLISMVLEILREIPKRTIIKFFSAFIWGYDKYTGEKFFWG